MYGNLNAACPFLNKTLLPLNIYIWNFVAKLIDIIMDKINDGNFIIIQRNNYLRIQKFNSKKPIVKLGKESGNRPRTIDFSSIEGKDYETIYKMVPDEQNEQGWRLEFIENCTEAEELYKSKYLTCFELPIYTIFKFSYPEALTKSNVNDEFTFIR